MFALNSACVDSVVKAVKHFSPCVSASAPSIMHLIHRILTLYRGNKTIQYPLASMYNAPSIFDLKHMVISLSDDKIQGRI
jgi:hypothetical protein